MSVRHTLTGVAVAVAAAAAIAAAVVLQEGQHVNRPPARTGQSVVQDSTGGAAVHQDL